MINEAFFAWMVKLTWDMLHSRDPARRRVAAEMLGRIDGIRMARWISNRVFGV